MCVRKAFRSKFTAPHKCKVVNPPNPCQSNPGEQSGRANRGRNQNGCKGGQVATCGLVLMNVMLGKRKKRESAIYTYIYIYMRDGFFMYYSLVYTEVHRELLCRRNKYDIIYIYIYIYIYGVFMCYSLVYTQVRRRRPP